MTPPETTIARSYRFSAHLRRWAVVVVAGALAAVAWWPLSSLEHSWGLESLYALRGPRPAPPQVVVIALHGAAAKALGVPARPDRWPRALHAELIERLHAHGAHAIAFDLLFERERDATDDARLARALREAGNGVLVAYLRREMHTVGGTAVAVDHWIPPMPALGDAAMATAAFALVKSNEGVLSYLAFAPEGDERPSLPWVLAAHHDAEAVRALGQVLRDPPTPTSELLSALRRAAGDRPGLLDKTVNGESAQTSRWRKALLEPGNEVYLNMYGPPGQIKTLAYDQALAALREGGAGAEAFRGAMVLVGSSEFSQTEQRDVYRTPWSTRDGLDVSGVELGATALANRLDDSVLRPLSGATAAAWMAALAMVWLLPWRLASARWAAPCWLGMAVAYGVAASSAFTHLNLWWPWAVPLFVLWPATGLCGLGLRVREVERQRQRLTLALSRYGPREEVARLARALRDGDDRVYVACLSSDIEGYTRRIEGLTPADARRWLNAYFERVFPIVRQHGGHVVDHAGDSMLCIWLSVHDHAQACQHAVAAARALSTALNDTPADPAAACAPTRLGLHFGAVSLGEVGDAAHAEQRVVGDIVNTASRIQSANKALGTRVLVSDVVAGYLPAGECRALGYFLLAGKQAPVGLAEPLGTTGTRLRERHAQALAAWEAGEWTEARYALDKLLAEWPQDGPARFMMNRVEQAVENNPPTIPASERRLIRLHLK